MIEKEQENINLEENFNMEDVFNQEFSSLDDLYVGQMIQASVVAINTEGVVVNVRGKYDSIISSNELKGEKDVEFKIDQKIQVVIRRIDHLNGYISVSWRDARNVVAFNELRDIYEKNGTTHGVIQREVKSGLIVKCDNGYNAFLPKSQVSMYYSDDVSHWINKLISFYILSVDEKDGRNFVIVSQRKLQQEQQQKERDEVFKNISIGDVVEGTVVNLMQYGALVDIGVTGLLHVKNVAWEHVDDVSNILKLNQKIKVKIIGCNMELQKVDLSLKALSKHPWDDIESRFSVGDIVEGKVINFEQYGVFIEIAPSIKGLLHVTEIEWKQTVVDHCSMFKKGQKLKVQILRINTKDKKVFLSLKRLGKNPWDVFSSECAVGDILSVQVSSMNTFGAFVRLANGIEGFIPIGYFSWVDRFQHSNEYLKLNQKIDVVVVEMDSKKERITLSTKHMTKNPFIEYKVSKVINDVPIVDIKDNGLVVRLKDSIDVFVPKYEIILKKNQSITDCFKIGDKVSGEIITSKQKTKTLILSLKKLENRLQENIEKKYINAHNPISLKDVFESL